MAWLSDRTTPQRRSPGFMPLIKSSSTRPKLPKSNTECGVESATRSKSCPWVPDFNDSATSSADLNATKGFVSDFVSELGVVAPAYARQRRSTQATARSPHTALSVVE